MRSVPTMLIAVLAAVTVTAAVAPAAGSAYAEPDAAGTGRFDLPWRGFAPASTVLRAGSPGEVGLDPAPIGAALASLAELTEPSGSVRPLFPGAVTLLVHDGVVVTHDVTGHAVRYADGDGTELPAEEWVPTRTDTIFDMASVTKLFTSIVTLQLVERGLVDLDATVASYLPEFAEGGKEAVTVQQLLTHTSGMRSWLPLWRSHPDPEARIHAALTDQIQAPPGTRYTYSDLNLITLGVLAERVTGSTVDILVAEGITGPLGMTDTGYNPDPAKLDRIAATEYQVTPPRGMVRGSVHDENAWSLDGVAGHAGIFSTAMDIAVLGQTILNGGSYRGTRILRPESVAAMLTNYNEAFPNNSHGLGFELNQRWFMDALSGPRTAGHTGYTGTSLVIDPASRSVVVLLTNRVHPSRDWGSVNPARRIAAGALSHALAVPPRHGPDAWFGGAADARTATLSATVQPRRTGSVRVAFDLFLDTESTDPLVLEASSDGTAWQPVPFTASGRGAPGETAGSVAGAGHRSWWTVRARLPGVAGEPLHLRWRYTTDPLYEGRGVYLDRIQVKDSRGVLIDGEDSPDAFTPDGWTLRSR